MVENKRYMVDDAGTLIDIESGECFDIVEEVVDLLNDLNNENEQLKQQISNLEDENKLLLLYMKEMRDKLTVYLQLKGV